MTKTDAAARIGTPEGAVRACVALIAAVTGQPEELTERYLDLYYQVRRQADQEKAREDFLLKWDDSTPMPVMQAVAGEPRAPEIADCHTSAAALARNDGPEKPAAKTGPSETRKKVDFEEVLASASAGARMPPEKKKGFAPYGAIKAEILSRYIDLRAKGMTIAQTVNLSGGKVTENQILNIMNGSKVGMDVYNAIEDAMNKWEQITASEAADKTDSIPN